MKYGEQIGPIYLPHGFPMLIARCSSVLYYIEPEEKIKRCLWNLATGAMSTIVPSY
jgi:hypothetical protein